MHERLFPQGLRFINLPYPEQWAHVQRLIEAIDKDEALDDDLAELVGAPIMAELRPAQVAYGAALGPIDALRERQASRAAGSGGGGEAVVSGPEVEEDASVTPTTPVPVVEDGGEAGTGQ